MPKFPFDFCPQNVKLEVALKWLFVSRLQTTNIELSWFVFQQTFDNLKKQIKLLAHLSENIFNNSKKEFFSFFRMLVLMV